MSSAPRDRSTAALVALVAAAAYLPTAARSVLGGDNGEFATLFHAPGVAHPPGYPLYLLYLRALSGLPAASPAHGAALATALLGAAAAAALFSAGRAWGASRGASAFAALAWALSSLPWRLATQAEVFALNALLAAALVAAAGPAAPLRGTRRAVALGALAGLGLGNHHSIVLLAPLGVFAMVRAARESRRPARAAALGVLASVPGLLTYGWLAAVARSGRDLWVWGDPRDLAGLLRHVARGDYGTTSLSASHGAPKALAHLAALGRHLVVDSLALPAALALVAVVALLRRPRAEGLPGRPDRAAALALVASLVVAGPVFASRFNAPLVAVGPLIVERFYLLPSLLIALLGALGADVVAARARVRPALLGALAAAFVLAVGARSLPRVRADHSRVMEDYVLDTLSVPLPRAVILGSGDHLLFGTLYAQRALRARPDVVYVNPDFLGLPPMRRRLEARTGVALGGVPSAAVEAWLRAGRPVYLANASIAEVVRAFPCYPVGTLLRVLPRGSSLPSPEQLLAVNERVFTRFRARPPRVRPGGWDLAATEPYARPWVTMARAAAARGQGEHAEALGARARRWLPAE